VPDQTTAGPASRRADSGTRITMRHVSKSFGTTHALTDVSFSVRPGEVLAVVGENGAGKSTLMKIVAGAESADTGEFVFNGETLPSLDEANATKLGIGMVHQDHSLVPHLTVAENIFAGRQPTRWGLIDVRTMRARAGELLERLDVRIAPDAVVGGLSPAEQQMVEIAKALSQNLTLLVLDEPTAALTMSETERLFQIVRELQRQGVAILYISHRLAEVFELADTILVLRDGRVVAERRSGTLTEHELMALMVGRELSLERRQRAEGHSLGEVRLAVRSLCAPPRVLDVSFEVRSGEILCLAGLIGAGRTETCEAIFGLRVPLSGSINLEGLPVVNRSPAEAMARGLAMIPEDRKEAGLFLEENIAWNIASTNLEEVSPRGWFSATRANALALRFVQRLRIRTSGTRQRVGRLSGGNQQKVLLAKWVARRPRVLMVDEPTRGVDVGARTEIYNVLRELAAEGTAVLLVSSDLTEVLSLSDRIVVLAEGRTAGTLEGDAATELEVLTLAAPGHADRQAAAS
jgi:ABC-type sugar transport system ATPase subunit